MNPRKQHQSYYRVSRTASTVNGITVEPSIALEEEEEEEEPEPVYLGSSSGQEGYLHRSGPGADYLDSGSNQLDTRSTSLSSDFGEESAYDRPHVCVDLGDGEFADGYQE